MKPKLWRYALQVVAEADGEIRHRDIRQRVLADQQSDSSPRTYAHGTADQTNEGMRVADGDPGDGVEVGAGGREDLAPTGGLQT